MRYSLLALALVSALLLGGCAAQTQLVPSPDATISPSVTPAAQQADALFTDRDLSGSYEEEDCIDILLTGTTASCQGKGVAITAEQDGAVTVTITREGIYRLSGTLDNGTILVDGDKEDKIQLVLDNAQVTSRTGAALYVRTADKVFVTLAPGSSNTLANGGSFEAIDDSNIDGAVFSKEDLTLNGTGTLAVVSPGGHGVVSKDDLVVTGGIYTIQAQGHGLQAKEGLAVAGGSLTVTAGEDGLHSGGDLTVQEGSFTLQCGDDGIHADGALLVLGGTIDITESCEGLEGQTVTMAGGVVSVAASDDGVNASNGSDSFGPQSDCRLEISGGVLTVSAGGDGLDSNGDLAVTGGQVYISAPDRGNGALDYSGEAVITGGTVIAAGSSAMACNFGSGSAQVSMMVTVDPQQAGSQITLADAQGKVLAQWTALQGYDNLVVSAPGLAVGETYTLTAGSTTTQLTPDTLIYGSGSGFGGMGGSRPFDMGGQQPDKGNRPQGMAPGQRPDRQPDGTAGPTPPKPAPDAPTGEAGEAA